MRTFHSSPRDHRLANFFSKSQFSSYSGSLAPYLPPGDEPDDQSRTRAAAKGSRLRALDKRELPTRPAMALRAHMLLACASTVAGRIFLYESSLTQSLPLPAPTSAPIGRRLNRCTSCGPDTADDGTGTCEITCDTSRRLSERSTVMHGRLSSYLATRPRSAELNSHLDALWELWGARRGLQSGLSTCQETRVTARCTPSPPPPASPPPFVCLSCGNSTTENAQQCEVP